MKFFAISLLSVVAAATAAHVDLQAKYTFSNVLKDDDDGYYKLYWNFTRATESIYFAVNVSTTGWIGFGISPNGMMPGSDVVIGGVNGGETYFHDRYAEGRFLPPIDTSQDWFLVNSEEENGFTVLEFSRNFTTCDPKDLDITSFTSRVVWSYRTTDLTDPTGAEASQHDFAGSRSINLLSGLPTRIEFPEDQESIQVNVSNVNIPAASTTYWCETIKLPPLLTNTTRYINRFAPVITPHVRSFVHHIIVSVCLQPLREEDVGVSAPCSTLNNSILSCLQGIPLGGWAVGGEEFIYPEGISFPIGGTGQQQYIIMEMHYDNPNNVADIIDSSGMIYYLTSEEPDQLAGVLTLGHNVESLMIIPPKSADYTIAGICDTSCIDTAIPEEGIRIFGNLLHTHLAGHGLVVEHYRYNEECDVLEELEPIDQNLNYDFNFQQTTLLPKEHLVLQGDILILKCFYDTTDRSNLTMGGQSTAEEMCLSFLNYYPRPTGGDILDACFSVVNPQTAFNNFYLYLNSFDPDLAVRFADNATFFPTLMELDWEQNPQHARELQYSVLNSTSIGVCSSPSVPFKLFNAKVPESECPFEAPNKCSGISPLSCCDRLTDGVPPQMHLSIVIALLMVLLSLLIVA